MLPVSLFPAAIGAALLASSISYAATVRIEVQTDQAAATSSQKRTAPHEVLVWLSARPGSLDPHLLAPVPGRFKIEQKNKSFQPHFLVVPAGSVVEFPNRDPFFHNVFSQFNGKRFDLGLYEAGSTRTVRFDHAGVSYIFCNIHSQMAAVIIALDTRLYTVLNGSGTAEWDDVPPGDYLIHVWQEGSEASQLAALAQQIHVTDAATSAASIRMPKAAAPTAHKNKFGDDYTPDASSSYPQ